jgi:hypothetical protein
MEDRRRSARRSWTLAAAGISVAICAATLTPAGSSTGPLSPLIGRLGLADIARNLALFAPLGVALALAGRPLRIVVFTSLLLSGSVEFAQLWIPGRLAGMRDLVANVGGAALGAWVVSGSSGWLAPCRRRAVGLAVGCGVMIWLVVLATACFFQREVPAPPYFAGWTPSLGQFEPYSGRVFQARLGPRSLPPAGAVEKGLGWLVALESAEPLVMEWEVGRAPEALAAVLVLIGPRHEEIFLVGVRGMDLVVRFWRRAATPGLEQPELVWPGALDGVLPGSRLRLVARPVGTGVEVELAGQPRAVIGLGPGRGWSLVVPDEWVGLRCRGWLDAIWLACLIFPLGFWMRSAGGLGGPTCGALAASAIALPAAVPQLGLAPAGAGEWGGVLAGVALGRSVSRAVRLHAEGMSLSSLWTARSI